MYVYARNTAMNFYIRQGFVPVDDKWLDVPGIAMEGIRFKKLLANLGSLK